MTKHLLIGLTLLFCLETKAEKIGVTRYTLGGVTGSVLGFGIGHAIQGRWLSDDGWIFTLLEVSTAAAIATQKVQVNSCSTVSGSTVCSTTNNSTTTALITAFFAVKVWEIIDVWWLPAKIKVGITPYEDGPRALLSYRF